MYWLSTSSRRSPQSLALVYIGIALAWPLWWVSVCSMLCLLIVEGVVVNFVLARRDFVTVGTDDDGPGLRLAVVAVATTALVAAVVVGYLRWTVPDRMLHDDTAEVVGIASSISEASATFTPQSPTASVDRATAMMSPKSAEAFKNEFANVAKDLTSKNISAQASTVSAGIEAIGPDAAQRRGDPARNAEHTRQADRHRGARTSGPTVQERRALAGRRRFADPLPLAEQACVVDLQAAIHHDLQSRRFAVTGHLFVPQALL